MTQLFPESGGRIRSGLGERHLLQGPGLCFVLVAILPIMLSFLGVCRGLVSGGIHEIWLCSDIRIRKVDKVSKVVHGGLPRRLYLRTSTLPT